MSDNKEEARKKLQKQLRDKKNARHGGERHDNRAALQQSTCLSLAGDDAQTLQLLLQAMSSPRAALQNAASSAMKEADEEEAPPTMLPRERSKVVGADEDEEEAPPTM